MVQHRGKTDVVEIRDRILDKGIVVDAWARVSPVGIAVTSSARVVVGDANSVAASAASGMDGGEFRSARERAAIGIVQKAFDAWNDHDVDGYTALLDQGYVGETYRTPAPLRGPDDARRAMATSFDTLPDLHFTIESALAVGDDVVVSWRAAPSQVPGCTVTRLQGRKIAHTWTYWDMPNGLQPRATALR